MTVVRSDAALQLTPGSIDAIGVRRLTRVIQRDEIVFGSDGASCASSPHSHPVGRRGVHVLDIHCLNVLNIFGDCDRVRRFERTVNL